MIILFSRSNEYVYKRNLDKWNIYGNRKKYIYIQPQNLEPSFYYLIKHHVHIIISIQREDLPCEHWDAYKLPFSTSGYNKQTSEADSLLDKYLIKLK